MSTQSSTIFSASPWSSRVLAIFRVVAGAIFISAGTMKLFGWPGGMPPGVHIELFSQMGLAGLLEVFGGTAITLGFLTRPVAFVLSGEMAVAYFQAHFPVSWFPTVNMGIPAILYCFFFLYLAFEGAPAWSVDALLARPARAVARTAA